MAHLGVQRDALGCYLAAVDARWPLEAAWLVGSRARGDELIDSDYDLVLVSPSFAGVPWIRRVVEVAAPWELDVPVQPLPFTRDELARKRREIGTIAEAMRDAMRLDGAVLAPEVVFMDPA